jgi:ABC-2 type transport system ATP-binding protein
MTAIEVESLVKAFGSVRAVDGLSFKVPKGQIVALLGGNGAGKTTTISMLLGILLPTSGKIRVLGTDMARNRYHVLHRMNFTSPYVDIPQRLTVIQNLKVYAKLYGVDHPAKRIDEISTLFDLGPLLNRRFGSLSAGQKTRVSLAKALINEPELLLMDEPTAALDPDTADRMRETLLDYQRQKNATIFMSSHNMPEVEKLCDRVLMMRNGRIVDDGTADVLIEKYGRTTLEEVFIHIARQEP